MKSYLLGALMLLPSLAAADEIICMTKLEGSNRDLLIKTCKEAAVPLQNFIDTEVLMSYDVVAGIILPGAIEYALVTDPLSPDHYKIADIIALSEGVCVATPGISVGLRVTLDAGRTLGITTDCTTES